MEYIEERRSGLDSREPETREEQGERRSGDDRRPLRRRVLKGVKLLYGDGSFSVNAIMKDQSENGARLEVDDPHMIPDEIVMHNELDGYKVDVKIARRDGNCLGVVFTGEKIPAGKAKSQFVGMLNSRPKPVEVVEERQVPISRHPDIIPRQPRRPAPSMKTFGTR